MRKSDIRILIHLSPLSPTVQPHLDKGRRDQSWRYPDRDEGTQEHREPEPTPLDIAWERKQGLSAFGLVPHPRGEHSNTRVYRDVSDNRSKYYSCFPSTCPHPGHPREGTWRGPAQAAGRDLTTEVTKYRDSVQDPRFQLQRQHNIPKNHKDLLHLTRLRTGSRATTCPTVLQQIQRKPHSSKATRACKPFSFTLGHEHLQRRAKVSKNTLPSRREGDRTNRQDAIFHHYPMRVAAHKGSQKSFRTYRSHIFLVSLVCMIHRETQTQLPG